MITTRRARPTSPITEDSPLETRPSPEAKRLKFDASPQSPEDDDDDEGHQEPPLQPFRIEYPSFDSIPVPSKSILKALLQQALKHDKENEQVQLHPAGILSLEQVLLPAVALEEEQALKRVQAKIQRDAPEYKSVVEDGRRLIRLSIRNAIQAIQVSRHQRLEIQTNRRQEALENARRERQQRREEQICQQQMELERQRQEAQEKRQQRFRSLQRQFPPNKNLWKEIVVLTRSRTQLEKEHRLWTQAREEQEVWRQNAGTTTIASVEADSLSTRLVPNNKAQQHNTAAFLQESTTRTVKDIVMASTRIQQGLLQVLNILEESEKARLQLYKEYRHNHRFQGYNNVNKPKNLIRLLSQED